MKRFVFAFVLCTLALNVASATEEEDDKKCLDDSGLTKEQLEKFDKMSDEEVEKNFPKLKKYLHCVFKAAKLFNDDESFNKENIIEAYNDEVEDVAKRIDGCIKEVKKGDAMEDKVINLHMCLAIQS